VDAAIVTTLQNKSPGKFGFPPFRVAGMGQISTEAMRRLEAEPTMTTSSSLKEVDTAIRSSTPGGGKNKYGGAHSTSILEP
jgi:hypothetical protein